MKNKNTKLIISGKEKDIQKCFCDSPNGQITSYFNFIEELEITNIQTLNTFCLNKFIKMSSLAFSFALITYKLLLYLSSI